VLCILGAALAAPRPDKAPAATSSYGAPAAPTYGAPAAPTYGAPAQPVCTLERVEQPTGISLKMINN